MIGQVAGRLPGVGLVAAPLVVLVAWIQVTGRAVGVALVVGVVACAAMVDLRERRMPDALTVTALVAALTPR